MTVINKVFLFVRLMESITKYCEVFLFKPCSAMLSTLWYELCVKLKSQFNYHLDMINTFISETYKINYKL